MNRLAAICLTTVWLMPMAASAMSLELPIGAQETAKRTEAFGSAQIPTERFTNGAVPTLTAEGSVTARAWKLPSAGMSTLQLMAPLREQLISSGFDVILDCESDQCGGFDFRYDIDLLPEPDMHVDLGDFRFLSARKATDDDTADYVSLVVSRGGNSGFVQMTNVGKPGLVESSVVTSTKSTEPQVTGTGLPDGSLATLLTTIGRAPLEDLSFETGSSRLSEDGFGSLAELAAYLKTNPDMSVALVGHTDAAGSLAGNMSLSKKRARSVLTRLVSAYDVPGNQLEAAGVGYLVPRASNLTSEGRTQNRRVEVILTSTR